MSPETITAIAGGVATVLSPIVSAIVYQFKMQRQHDLRLTLGNKAFGDLKARMDALEERQRALEVDTALRRPPP